MSEYDSAAARRALQEMVKAIDRKMKTTFYVPRAVTGDGICQFCGKWLDQCGCLDQIEVAEMPVVMDPNTGKQVPQYPDRIYTAPTRQELAEQRVQKPTKPVTNESQCYLCGLKAKQASLVQSRSTAFFVCAGCALLHLGE